MLRFGTFLAFFAAVLCGVSASAVAQPAEGSVDADSGIISNVRLESGVPLGGIGTGKVELLTDGAFGNITINRNSEQPIPLARGSFFAVRTTGGSPGTQTTRVLALSNAYRFPGIGSTRYLGRFPRAVLDCSDAELPVDIRIEAWSPLLPQNLADSTIPAIVFDVQISNPAGMSRPLTLALSWENLLGCGGNGAAAWKNRTGNYQEERQGEGFKGLLFKTRGERPEEQQVSAGEYALIAAAPAGSVRVLPYWNAAGAGDDFWTSLDDDAPLSTSPQARPGKEGEVHPAGAAGIQMVAPAESSVRARFVLAWRPAASPALVATNAPVAGARFPDAWATAVHVARNADTLRSGIEQWQGLVDNSSLPAWLRSKLLNDLYPLVSNSQLTAGGEFRLIDGIGGGAPAGAGRSWLVTSAALRSFYPQLAQDLGNSPGEAPGPESACERIIQHWTRYRGDGDLIALRAALPDLRLMLDRLAALDADGDGLPEGPTSWTYAPAPGAFSYTAGLYLASLEAARTMATALDDRKLLETTEARMRSAREAALTELWNGRYIIRHLDPLTGIRSTNLFAGAVAGDAASAFTGLGRQYPPEVSESALRAMLDLLATPTGYVTPNEVRNDGSLDPAASGHSWPGYLETWLAAPAAAADRADLALRMVYHLHEMRWAVTRTPWNSPLGYDPRTGAPYGPRQHPSCLGSWNLYSALVGVDMDEPAARLTVVPAMPAAATELRVPFFAPRRWLWVEHLRTPSSASMHLRVRLLKRFDERPDPLREIVTSMPPALGGDNPLILVTGPEGEIPSEIFRENRRLRIRFKTPYEWRLYETIEVAIVPQRANNLMVQIDPPRSLSLGSDVEAEAIRTVDRDIHFNLVNPTPGQQVANVRFRDLREQPYDVYVNGIETGRFTPADSETRLAVIVPGSPIEIERVVRLRGYRTRLAAARDASSGTASAAVDPLLAVIDRALAADLEARTAQVLLHPVRRGIIRRNPLEEKPPIIDAGDPEPAVTEAEQALQQAPRQFAAIEDPELRRRLLMALFPVAVDLSVVENAAGDPQAVRLTLANSSDVPVRALAALTLPPEWGGAAPARLLVGAQETGAVNISPQSMPEQQARRAAVTGTATITAAGVSWQLPLAAQIGHSYIRDWSVIGTWPGRGAAALAVALPPDMGIQPEAEYDGRRWQTSPDSEPPIDLGYLAGPTPGGIAFAATEIYSPAAGRYFLDLGVDGLVQVRLNGVVVHTNVEPGAARPGDQRIPVDLVAGWNRIVLKLVRTRPTWNLLAEITDENRVTLAGLRTRPPAAG